MFYSITLTETLTETIYFLSLGFRTRSIVQETDTRGGGGRRVWTLELEDIEKIKIHCYKKKRERLTLSNLLTKLNFKTVSC